MHKQKIKSTNKMNEARDIRQIDAVLPPYVSDDELTLQFTNDEVKTIQIRAWSSYITIAVFRNANMFMLENGEPLKPVYSLINENEHEYEKSILLRIKGRQPNLVLQYNGISERYSSDMHVSVVINVKDFTYELPQLTNSHLIIAYANKPTHYVKRISQSSYGYYQGNLYFTDIHENYGTCVHIDMEKSVEYEISGIFDVDGCLPAFKDAKKVEVIFSDELKTLKIDSTPIKVICMTKCEQIVVMSNAEGIKREDNYTDDSSILSSTNGPQNILVFFIKKSFWSSKYNYSVNTISEMQSAYYFESSNTNQYIYSYSPFSVKVRYYIGPQSKSRSHIYCKNNNNELLLSEDLKESEIYSCSHTNYINILLIDGRIELSDFKFDDPKISNEGYPQYDNGNLKPLWLPKTQTSNETSGTDNQKNSSSNKAPAGAISGIVIGIIIEIAIFIIAFIVIRKYKSSTTNTDVGEEV